MNNILWTGGWDSTFRLLDLVVNKKRKVQPYYILDDGRSSQSTEIKTMNNIKVKLYEKFPDTNGLIKDTIFIKKSKIPSNRIITDKFNRLLNNSFMGSQYDWLARFANDAKIYDLELNIHKDDKASHFLQNIVHKETDDNDTYFKLNPDMLGTDYDLFKYYHFPILELSKIHMQRIAKQNHFDGLMEMTWFCFNPTWRGTPCGYCNPCKYTREEGLGRRVPGRLMSKYNHLENKVYYKLKNGIGGKR